ncbi:MAG: hypothetical protein ACYS8W_14225 [Planctomycetota bacterium]|jgi:hypothetical protein
MENFVPFRKSKGLPSAANELAKTIKEGLAAKANLEAHRHGELVTAAEKTTEATRKAVEENRNIAAAQQRTARAIEALVYEAKDHRVGARVAQKWSFIFMILTAIIGAASVIAQIVIMK